MVFVNFLFFLISVVFYLQSPQVYSLSFCTSVLILFFINSIWFLKFELKEGNYFNFHVFFLISFFFSNFVYPVFLYPIDPEYFTIFRYFFKHTLISKATAMSQLGLSSYILGSSFYLTIKKNNKKRIVYDYTFEPLIIKIITNLSLITSIMFLFFVVVNSKDDTINNQFVSILIVLISISLLMNAYQHRNLIRNNLKNYIKLNKINLISVCLLILSSIWFGDRGPAIQMMFIFLYIIVFFVRKLSFKFLMIFLVIGMVGMSLISNTRNTENNLKNSSITSVIGEGANQFKQFGSIWDFGMDLIVTTRNLYVGIDYAEQNGYLYGKGYFQYLFSFIPGLPYYISVQSFGKPPSELSSGYIITEETGIGWGAGSNAIVDVYMNFGEIGVIIIFIFFGYIITMLETKENIYAKLSYILLFALAIYYPRSSLFIQFSVVIRSLIILFLLLNLYKGIYKSSKKYSIYESSHRR